MYTSGRPAEYKSSSQGQQGATAGQATVARTLTLSTCTHNIHVRLD